MSFELSRRQFLLTAGSATVLGATEAKSAEEPVAFFLVGDTHVLANKDAPTKIDLRSATVNSQLIDQLNRLPGTEIPKEAGGGKVRTPRGLIHAGDCIDSGDKSNLAMQETEWAGFTEYFGLTGIDGKLKLPIYEVHGNHDSPRGDGLAVKKIIERNKKRPGVTNISSSGVHYSWDWAGVHFINLGIVVGQTKQVDRKRRYNPLGSLDFLISDLAKNVGNSNKPVVITHHIDLLRYSQPLPVADAKAISMEWDPADVHAFYDAIKDYRIAAILYGHTHARNVYQWNGTNKAVKDGIAVFNVDNSSHFHSKLQACFYFEIGATELVVREFQTTDAWLTGKWNPQVWKTPLPATK
ncbi:MAG: metallophosphoesterase [Zavarzinella sp.]